jgi:TRAP transporter TAXI family solute receptor
MYSRYLRNVLIVIVICALVAASIGGVESAQKKKPISLVIATATIEDIYYPMGVGMASLWTVRLVRNQGIQVQAITSAGSGENVNMLKGKEVDLAIFQGLFGKMAWNGRGIYKQPYKQLRAISTLWPNVEHFVIYSNKLKTGTVTDIKGLRFSLGRVGSGAERSGLTIMSGLGMSRNDVEAEYLGYFESSKAMMDRRVDGANLPGGLPASEVIEVYTTPGMKVLLLEFTDEQLEQIKEKTPYPGFRYIIPANTYPGQAKPVRSIAQPNFLGVRMDVDQEVIYLLTKTLFDNSNYMKQVHKMGTFVNLENALSGLPAPLHAGSYKYYKDQGLEIPDTLIPPEVR